ncbi:unnamed protein product [Rotaria sordida]|uniref:Uncharacterized protein n=1 Tax=Rotaria sordida TaxID=392033 RepID=A0A819QRF3_9BILA|nr:unnamed protein product [Rotaria sordida]CAF4035699.1 unnamed protein product [Rotaria sordida]
MITIQCTCVFLLMITLTFIQTINSSGIIDNDKNENKFDEIEQIPSLLLLEKRQTNIHECLSKNHLSNILNRNQRASISRPYFNYWRPVRDNVRYSTKNSIAFSPRLGKRANQDRDQLENPDKNIVNRSIDLETFLITLMSYLQEKKIDIIYEDSTKICFSQPIDITFIQQILDKYNTNRRYQNEQIKEDIHERQSIGKHPVLFRYRLG